MSHYQILLKITKSYNENYSGDKYHKIKIKCCSCFKGKHMGGICNLTYIIIICYNIKYGLGFSKIL